VPFGVSLIVCAQFARWLRIRVGPRWPAVLGLGLMTAGFALLATTTGATSKTQLVVPLVITGLGAGVANASLTGFAVLDLPAGRINEAAGWISLSRFLGSALAIAVGTATYLSIGRPDAPAGTGESGATTFDVAVARLDQDLFSPLITATQEATAERFARTMLLTAVVLGIITLVSWWLLGRGEPR
jgi:MFS family permease